MDREVQGSPKECFPGLVNFVTAVAYHLCLNLPRAFSQPGKHSFGDPCTAVSSEAWAKLRDWASVAVRGRLLLSGSVAHASLKTAVQVIISYETESRPEVVVKHQPRRLIGDQGVNNTTSKFTNLVPIRAKKRIV